MKAAVVYAYGKPPRYEDFPDPRPAQGEALIQICATGLHPVVKSRAAGLSYSEHGQLPLVPGVDGIGRLEDGRRVYFANPRSPYGTLSDLTVAREAACFALREALDRGGRHELRAAINEVQPGLSADSEPQTHRRQRYAVAYDLLTIPTRPAIPRLRLEPRPLKEVHEALVFACKRLTSRGQLVRCLGSAYLPGPGRMLSLFEAETGEAVRTVNENVHAPFVSLEAAIKIDSAQGLTAL